MSNPNPPAERPMILESDPWAEENPYEVLDVPRDSDRTRIKSAYRSIQKRAKRGDSTWTAAQVANESLTKPRKRLLVDLFVVAEKRLYEEIVRRYGEIGFDAVPKDLAPLLLRSTDLEWGRITDDFSVPETPRVVFSRLQPAVTQSDVDVVMFGVAPRS